MEPHDNGLRRKTGLLLFIIVLVILAAVTAWLVTRDSTATAAIHLSVSQLP